MSTTRTITVEARELAAGDVIVPTDRDGGKARKVYAATRIPNGCGFPEGTVGYRKANWNIQFSNRSVTVSEDHEFEMLLWS